LRDGHLPLVDLTFHLRDELLVGRADLAHLLLARLLGVGELLREPGIVTLERADALAQVSDALAELAGFQRQVGRQLLVALGRVGQLPLEARVLCVERVVAGLGGLNGFRVLALRDASGSTERDKGESGDRHERLAHLWSPRSQKSGELPADPLWQRRSRSTKEVARPAQPALAGWATDTSRLAASTARRTALR